MLASAFRRIGVAASIAVLSGSAALVHPTLAQHVVLDAPGLLGTKKAPPPPAQRAPPTVWPRLDPGAVLCRTADDLDRHAANMTARVSGGETVPADCRIIANPTAIQIVSRQGLGRTEVKLNAQDAESGWTDAWLPDRAPATR
jgi:hypothetical protein